jgi:hypothetical protein
LTGKGEGRTSAVPVLLIRLPQPAPAVQVRRQRAARPACVATLIKVKTRERHARSTGVVGARWRAPGTAIT